MSPHPATVRNVAKSTWPMSARASSAGHGADGYSTTRSLVSTRMIRLPASRVQMQRFGPSSRLAWPRSARVLAVFKSVRASLATMTPTWTVSVSALHVIQGHPAHIPRGQRLASSPDLRSRT